MKCPKCKAPLATAEYEGVEIDRCTKCKGIWLDEGELSVILKNEEIPMPDSIVKATISHAKSGIPSEEVASVELCPKCDSHLQAVNYNYASGVIVDVCTNHHGVWFDPEELEEVQAHYEYWEKKAQQEGQKWGQLAKRKDAEAQEAHEERIKQNEGILASVFRYLGKVVTHR